MTKVYAVADEVPIWARFYITAGKEYEAEDHGKWFETEDDVGENRVCYWGDCYHLDGGNWRRVER